MAIITCPECGQNPVSDRAPTCPKCGCPIAAGGAVPSSSGPAGQAPTIRQQREAQLPPGSYLNSDSEFTDSSVGMHLIGAQAVDLHELVERIQGWCEELIVGFGTRAHHLSMFGRLPHLTSLHISSCELDDEALLQIGKLHTLTKLKIFHRTGTPTEAGWLQLARLERLEFLKLPFSMLPSPLDLARERRLKQELTELMPQTIVK